MLARLSEPYLNPFLDKTTEYARQYKCSHTMIVYTSLALAGATFLFIVTSLFTLAFLSLILQRVSIGVAERLTAESGEASSYGQYMRHFSDYVFFGGFLFFFIMSEVGMAVPGAFLFFAFYLNEASNFAYNQSLLDTLRAAGKEKETALPFKTLFGLVDHGVVTVFFLLMCLIPVAFPFFAVILGFLCFASAFGRFLEVRMLNAETTDPLDAMMPHEEDSDDSDDDDHQDDAADEASASKKPKK